MPATLATHDYHTHGRLSHIITARVEGIPASKGILSMFTVKQHAASHISGHIPFKEDFEAVIARSDKLANDLAAGKKIASPPGSPILPAADLPVEHGSPHEAGSGSPKLLGLYTRRQSSDSPRPSQAELLPRHEPDNWSSTQSIGGDGRTEKAGWLKGDICAVRFLLVHANPSPTGDVSRLDLRKEGFVQGLNSWRFTATSEVVRPFHCACTCLLC